MHNPSEPARTSLSTITAAASGVGAEPGSAEVSKTEPVRALSEAAKRALAEAEARRAEREAAAAKSAPSAEPREIGGPTGPEPVRYGDWEKGGIAWDF